MRVLGRLALPMWLVMLGVIVMYVFFVIVANVSPAQVAAITILVAVLTILFILRSMRVESELADRGGDPSVRRALNRARERRGF
jgi:hypothetical protein